MIRKLLDADRESVLEFLDQEPEINLYIIGDIKNFGLDAADACVYAEFSSTGAYRSVLSRNLSHLVYYAISPDFNTDWLPIIRQFDFLFISGKASVIEPLVAHFPDTVPDRLEFMKSTVFTPEPDWVLDDLEVVQNEQDALAVYKLLNRIKELESVRKKTQEEFIQHLLDNSGENGTTLFKRENGAVIASASAVGETRRTAMIVGVATHPDFRKRGLGKNILNQLVDLYVNKKQKTLCLYYDDPRAGQLYEQLGFVRIEDWVMLVKKNG